MFVAYLKAIFPGWVGVIFAAVDILGIWQFAQAVRGGSTLVDAPVWVWGVVLFGTFGIANYMAFSRLRHSYERLIEKKSHRIQLGALLLSGQDISRLIRSQLQGGFATAQEYQAYSSWVQSVETYLREHLDTGYLARFSFNAGLNLLFGREYPSRRRLSDDLAIRLDRLASFINELTNETGSRLSG